MSEQDTSAPQTPMAEPQAPAYSFPLPQGFILVPIQPPAMLVMAEMIGIPANQAAQMYSTIIKALALQQPLVAPNGIMLACPCGEPLLGAIGYPEVGTAIVRVSKAATVTVACSCGLVHDLKTQFKDAMGTANIIEVEARSPEPLMESEGTLPLAKEGEGEGKPDNVVELNADKKTEKPVH